MAQMRIYVVTSKGEEGVAGARLVKASHPSKAIAHVQKDMGLDARVASQDDLVTLIAAGGVKVEDSGEP